MKLLKKLYGYRCAHCKRLETQANPLTVDHIVPRFFGGGNNTMNKQPLCLECNGLKGANMSRMKEDLGIRKRLEPSLNKV